MCRHLVCRSVLAILLAVAGTGVPVHAFEEVRIGVLSHRGEVTTRTMWSPTAEYLNQSVPGYRFTIVPLTFEAVNPEMARGGVDFILVNPGIYVNLEVAFGASRIATLNNRRHGLAYNIFGGVIFTRADRDDLKTIADLRGSSFMAVDKISLGGFQMAWREMLEHGVDPYRDFSRIDFASTHDAVVMAVRDGQVDVGTVRTDILERMEAAGVISSREFKVINPRPNPDFPFALSTRVYPEWPFAKAPATGNDLAQAVAIALMQMPPDHSAALAGEYAGWTVPLDYQPVHEIFKQLKISPYAELGRFTLADVWRRYWPVILMALGVLVVLMLLLGWVWRLNNALERAKRGLERRHELILNSVGDAIMGVDMRGKATFINPAAERIVGWGAADLVGANLHELLHHTRLDGTPHPANECPVYTTFRSGEQHFVAEDLFWTKDGDAFPVEYLSTPVRNEAGDVVGAVVVFRDLTERKQAEEEVHQHRTELAHVARLSTMGELASGIAHELNQPLAAISNYTSGSIRMLRGGNWEEEKLLNALESASTQAQRAGDIIRELRHFIRKEEPGRSLLDLNQLVKSAAVLLEPEVRREGVVLELELDATLQPVLAYGIQIEQVILNLVRNAIEAMHEQPASHQRLRIRTEKIAGRKVAVVVRDWGPGIAETVADRLFDPFYTTKASGMGLGLSISHGIVYSHGGELRAFNNDDAGATFRIELPVAEEITEHAV